MTSHATGITDGSIIVLYVDECHLIWDDVRGYVWAPSNQRVAVPMTNFRERQTYYSNPTRVVNGLLWQPHQGAELGEKRSGGFTTHIGSL